MPSPCRSRYDRTVAAIDQLQLLGYWLSKNRRVEGRWNIQRRTISCWLYRPARPSPRTSSSPHSFIPDSTLQTPFGSSPCPATSDVQSWAQAFEPAEPSLRGPSLSRAFGRLERSLGSGLTVAQAQAGRQASA